VIAEGATTEDDAKEGDGGAVEEDTDETAGEKYT
jgi:hypothetical protein